MVTSLLSVPFPSYEQSQAEPIELSSNSYFNLSLTLSQSYCEPVNSPTSQSFFLEFIWAVNKNSPGPKRWLADLTESQPHISFFDGLSFCATNFSQLLLGKTVDREVSYKVCLLLFEIFSSWSCPQVVEPVVRYHNLSHSSTGKQVCCYFQDFMACAEHH